MELYPAVAAHAAAASLGGVLSNVMRFAPRRGGCNVIDAVGGERYAEREVAQTLVKLGGRF